MRARSIVASVLPLAAAVSVGSPRNIPIGLDAPLDSGRYPACPEDYDAYCCTKVIPYSNRCQRGNCENKEGWSCLQGLGKVASMRHCLANAGSPQSAYCKKPGEENFASVLRWTGDSFDAVLRPTQYKTFLKAGMPEPWVPMESEIRWEGDDHNRDKHDSPIDDPEPGELRRDVGFVEEEEMV
ncbi:hypothetical protein AB5N19_11964 [Seiridium cardinale]|uniref:Extracellular membrane protein CFEM domain-containing protein n=1 Tax=Seiridium cardinale TaxID=138064 RepID=A0ABR2XQA4_9PEZI